MLNLKSMNYKEEIPTLPNTKGELLAAPHRIEMTASVFNAVRNTIGKVPAEAGGILGMQGETITHFYYDRVPNGRTRATYTQNHEAVDNVLSENWTPKGVVYMGAVHSHPAGCVVPSWGDREYAQRLLDNNMNFDQAKPYFYIPIVQSSADTNEFRLFSYVAYYADKKFCTAKVDLFVDRQLYQPKRVIEPLVPARPKPSEKLYVYPKFKFPISWEVNALGIGQQSQTKSILPSEKSTERLADRQENRSAILTSPRHNFDRVQSLFPSELMQQKTVICIGAGGARSFLENLARCGIKRFVLLDGDTVSETNIATQSVYYSEIGVSKVEAIQKRILDICPEAHVIAINRFFDENMTDKEFTELIGESCRRALADAPHDILIAGLTDNFFANARASRLALQFGVAYIQAGIYEKGTAAEIFFSYPGVTPSCTRCATASRYEHYANGFTNTATSEGCPIFTTDVLNGIKGFISLMLLLHDTPTRFGKYLNEYAGRNFLQINFDPFSSLFPGAPIGGVQYFEQVPNHPVNGCEKCPDCQGTGDLLSVKGTIHDTRKIFEQEVR